MHLLLFEDIWGKITILPSIYLTWCGRETCSKSSWKTFSCLRRVYLSFLHKPQGTFRGLHSNKKNRVFLYIFSRNVWSEWDLQREIYHVPWYFQRKTRNIANKYSRGWSQDINCWLWVHQNWYRQDIIDNTTDLNYCEELLTRLNAGFVFQENSITIYDDHYDTDTNLFNMNTDESDEGAWRSFGKRSLSCR